MNLALSELLSIAPIHIEKMQKKTFALNSR